MCAEPLEVAHASGGEVWDRGCPSCSWWVRARSGISGVRSYGKKDISCWVWGP